MDTQVAEKDAAILGMIGMILAFIMKKMRTMYEFVA